VINVDDMISDVLQRRMPPLGFQCMVAIDLVPVMPYTAGAAYLASSTGHTLRFPYQPEQRHVLSWVLRKALLGYVPKLPLKSREAILTGAVETTDEQRDWKSLASYAANKVIAMCSLDGAALRNALNEEVPYVADLVPIRKIILDADGKDRYRRELESKRVTCMITLGVDSLRAGGDMPNEFKSFITLNINDISPSNGVLVVFMQNNQGIDGVMPSAVAKEVERCAPPSGKGDVVYQVTVTSQGAHIQFSCQTDRQKVQQWINTIAARSIGWRIPTAPFSALKEVEVEHVEILFSVKCGSSTKKFKQLLKQRYVSPLPHPTIRFLGVAITD
jgi:hypothetical protein